MSDLGWWGLATDRERLGEVAFAAYRESVGGKAYDGTPIPEWAEISDAVRQAWIEAGFAVFVHLTGTQGITRMTKLLKSRDFWLAVGALAVTVAGILGFVFPEVVVNLWDLFINNLPGA